MGEEEGEEMEEEGEEKGEGKEGEGRGEGDCGLVVVGGGRITGVGGVGRSGGLLVKEEERGGQEEQVQLFV